MTEVKKEAKQAKGNASKVVDDYKKLAEFREEVNEALTYSYEYGFEDYKAKVKDIFSSIDLKNVILLGHEEKEKNEEVEIIEEGKIQEEHSMEEIIIERPVIPTIADIEETILPILEKICQAPLVPEEDV